MSSIEETLWWDCYFAEEIGKVKQLLSSPKIRNLNWKNLKFGGGTALHAACERSSEQTIGHLLSHPSIEVNDEDIDGNTPLIGACRRGNSTIIKLILEDQRVDINKKNHDGQTALWIICNHSCDYNVKLLLASGKAIDTLSIKSAAQIARIHEKEYAVTLIEEYQNDPEETIKKLREELKWMCC